jgi:hypothetical protein
VSLFVPQGLGFAFEARPADIFMGEGMHYYTVGNFDEALYQFNKVLLVDPYNAKAQEYIKDIKRQCGAVTRFDVVSQSLDEAESVLRRVSSQYPYMVQPGGPAVEESKPGEKIEHYVDVKGVTQVAVGVRSPDEAIWKEANGDLNERSYRILWSDSRHNTYDPAIYDRLQVAVDTKNLKDIGLENISTHANMVVDPWSFTGKSEKFTLAGAGGDRAEFELKYWSNTSRTVNEIVPTLWNGDSMALPEIQVTDGATVPTTVKTTFSNIYDIPSVKIQRDFQPLREFWIESKGDALHWRVFPFAYQDQAYASDDPLNISNRHTWWEESPWLAEWNPGNLNIAAFPNDFTKGVWDDSLAFFTRDSDGLRLTQLRGVSFAYTGIDGSLDGTLASPKNLWSDYTYFDTTAGALRGKLDLAYNLGVGATYTGHFGYFDHKLDGLDNVFSVDAKYEPAFGAKVLGQVAVNDASYDRTNDEYATKRRGNAYLVSLINRFPAEEIYTKDYGYIKKNPGEKAFLKTRFTLARMEDEFDPSLATYRQTRDDEFWSRHISFRKHPLYLYTGLTKPMKFDDIRPFAIGDGIDTNRDVVGIRLEGALTLFEKELESLLDVRNVHNADSGSFMENVARIELEYPFTKKFKAKFLGIRQDMAETTANRDPFVFNPTLNSYLINNAIAGGQDPSLATVSLGGEYRLTEKFAVNGVWEHTNDMTASTDNYPRGLFNSSNFVTYTQDGKTYREPIPFLYSQQYFDLPPYAYFDIYKFGFSFAPVRELEFYLDFAYNQNKTAGQIDDNMNHYGLEVAYVPSEKLSFLFKYTVSRWLDMVELNASGHEITGWHNNFFIESRYHVDPTSEFVFEYGVGGITPLGTASYDPFGGALAVLDTQHLVRLYYRKSF